MENQLTIVESDLTRELASAYKVEPSELIRTVKAMCFEGGAASDAQLIVFLTISKQLALSPFNRELYAFVKNGKMQTIVGVDGWIKLVNRDARFGGFKFVDHNDSDGNLVAVTCQMFRKDWPQPGEATEYLIECMGATDPWKKWPRRMLRNKAYIQCARLTFGFAGAIDPDEAERIANAGAWPTSPDAEAVRVVSGAVDEDTGEVIDATPPADVKAELEASAKEFPDEPTPEPEPEAVKKGRPKSARSRLKEMSKDLPAARIVVMLGQLGVAKIEDVTEEQAAAAVARLERRKA